jgi:hypothetical protein
LNALVTDLPTLLVITEGIACLLINAAKLSPNGSVAGVLESFCPFPLANGTRECEWRPLDISRLMVHLSKLGSG